MLGVGRDLFSRVASCRPRCGIFVAAVFQGILFIGCAGFGPPTKTRAEIAAENATVGKRTELLELENKILREENLQLTRDNELERAEHARKQSEYVALDAKRLQQIASIEQSISNLKEKIAILEADASGKIKQLTQLNAELARKSQEAQAKLQDDLARAQRSAAEEREKLLREAADKQFAQGKEINEIKTQLSEKDTTIGKLREELRIAEAEITLLKNPQPKSPP